MTDAMRVAYGRADCAASCARFSLAVATSCNALVIFCVDFTLAIRRRNSFKLGMGYALSSSFPGYANVFENDSSVALIASSILAPSLPFLPMSFWSRMSASRACLSARMWRSSSAS